MAASSGPKLKPPALPGDTYHLLSRRELVAERAAWCALHDCLVTGESHFAATSRGNVEVGLANEQRAEFWLAKCAKELCETAVRYIEFECFLIMAEYVHRNIPLGTFDLAVWMAAHLRRGPPSMPLPISANSCFDQSRTVSDRQVKSRKCATHLWHPRRGPLYSAPPELPTALS